MTDIDRSYSGPLERVDDCCYRIPKSYRPGMRVDGLVFADERLIEHVRFRAAYDFLLLRAASGQCDAELAHWWEAYLEADHTARAELIAQANACRSKGTGTKRRRRRRPAAPPPAA